MLKNSDNQVRVIHADELYPQALALKDQHYRLVQICATANPEGYELMYSFGLEYELLSLVIQLKENQEIVTISNIFPPAFLYENEIHDLFGVEIKLMTLDYHGNLYRTQQKTPYKNKGKEE